MFWCQVYKHLQLLIYNNIHPLDESSPSSLHNDLFGLFFQVFFFFFKFNLIVFFLLPFSPRILPQQSPHCYPCPWVCFPFCLVPLPLLFSSCPQLPLALTLFSIYESPHFPCYFRLFIRFHIWVTGFDLKYILSDISIAIPDFGFICMGCPLPLLNF